MEYLDPNELHYALTNFLSRYVPVPVVCNNILTYLRGNDRVLRSEVDLQNKSLKTLLWFCESFLDKQLPVNETFIEVVTMMILSYTLDYRILYYSDRIQKSLELSSDVLHSRMIHSLGRMFQDGSKYICSLQEKELLKFLSEKIFDEIELYPWAKKQNIDTEILINISIKISAALNKVINNNIVDVITEVLQEYQTEKG